MKTIEKEKAIELRRQGKTLSEIMEIVPVSKGSLSYWLHDIKLTNRQIGRIKYKNDKIKCKFIEYNLMKKEKALKAKEAIFNSAAREIGKLSREQLRLVGIALYWAEGYRAHACSSVDFTNSDPEMIKLIMRWFRDVCGVPEERFRVRLQLHGVPEEDKAKVYWSKITGVPNKQFTKAYIKTSPSSKNKTGRVLPYGICSVRVFDTALFNKIQGWIKGLMALSSSPA